MKTWGYYLASLVLILGLMFSACAAPQKAAPAATQKPVVASPAPAAPQLTREQQLVEAAKKEGEVVLWVTNIEEREKLIGLFQARYPFLTLKIWDGDGSLILSRMGEETKIGRHSVDVVMLSAEMRSARDMGVLTEYEFPNTVGWTDQPKHKYYAAYYATARLLVYNTDLVSPSEVPKSWDDAKSTKWAGKTFASTSGQDLPLYFAHLWRQNDQLNWDRSFAFWEDFIRNTKPRLASGHTGIMTRMAAGEAAFYITPQGSAMGIMAKGAPLGVAPVGVAPGGASGMALVKDAPHPNAARLLIDWLTTPEGLLAYANPRNVIVLDPKLKGKAKANLFMTSIGYDLIPYDLVTTENLRKSTDFWNKAVGIRG